MMPPSCKVVRGGEISSIPAQELVKGDIVFIKMGDKVPADLVLFAAVDIKVDNSSVSLFASHLAPSTCLCRVTPWVLVCANGIILLNS